MKNKLHAVSAAVLLAMAAAAPAQAGLERVGPVIPSAVKPSVGGFPSWYQDKTGVTLEFCDPTTTGEVDGGWCLLLPGDVVIPEVFPTNFFDEHFYYAADNVLADPATGFNAKLVIALEAAFAVGPAIEGDQVVFARHRIDMKPLPFDGDYRVITPFSDVTYFDQVAGARIFDTEDIGIACAKGDFSCALDGRLGPFLLPSALAGGAEVPPMPDLASAPAGTDPHFDLLVAQGGTTAAPGTGKKYVADPARVGPVTGSPLPQFTANNTDGTTTLRNHNTFRIEVRPSTPDRNAPVFYTLDGETNFSLMGRLMDGMIPGRVTGGRAVYRADPTGAATDVDVFTTANSTLQARIPAQPIEGEVKPVLAFYPQPCEGAISIDVNGNTVINPGPYSAPAGVTPTNLVNDAGSSDYWAQAAVTGVPPSHVCIVDTNARNAAGQVQPTYTLKAVTDDVVVKTAAYNGPDGGVLAVTAESSDPTAVLTLAGFGSTPAADGSYSGRGPGAELTANAVTVKAIKSPPNQVQVVSSKGGAGFHIVQTARGMSVTAGQVIAGNVSGTIVEDCSTTPALSCAAGQSLTIDLLAGSSVVDGGVTKTVRQAVLDGGTATVAIVQGARLGTATVSSDGFLSYVPNGNASGTDAVTFTVSFNGGTASSPAMANITVTPVNDAPVAGNTSLNAIQGIAVPLNLIGTSTDPDGITDVKNAIITSWPVELGAQPVPVNGAISVTATTTGNFTIGYKVVDAAGAESANAGTTTVVAVAGETITLGRVQFEAGKNRWRVDGTDTIRNSQTISITFANGIIGRGANAGQACDGSDRLPECVIGTTGVTATGAFSLDAQFSNQAFQNPSSAGGWATLPTRVRAWSSNPVLGGDATATFTRK
jgi:hypothetical protein